jgi:4-hydroxythreonine-4-phosphate dehydrogenase
METHNTNKPRIALTMGDPNGVGPEITVKALWHLKDSEIADWILVGDEDIFNAASKLLGLPLKFESVSSDTLECGTQDIWRVVSTGHKLKPHPGVMEKESAQAAYQAMETAASLCTSKKTSGMVTAPISKEAFHQIGIKFPGQTEILAKSAQVDKTVMCFIAGQLRVALATTHLPLKDVPGALSIEGLSRTIGILHDFLSDVLKLSDPLIGVCALNPHGGEGGIFGIEEESIILPAIRRILSRGIRISGPVPADVIFQRAETYDAILALYHDQGMIPVKRIAGMRAVNVTLGLPFIRTSPDHGTAFDIAWSGKVDPTSMMEAMTLAAELVIKSRS